MGGSVGAGVESGRELYETTVVVVKEAQQKGASVPFEVSGCGRWALKR